MNSKRKIKKLRKCIRKLKRAIKNIDKRVCKHKAHGAYKPYHYVCLDCGFKLN